MGFAAKSSKQKGSPQNPDSQGVRALFEALDPLLQPILVFIGKAFRFRAEQLHEWRLRLRKGSHRPSGADSSS